MIILTVSLFFRSKNLKIFLLNLPKLAAAVCRKTIRQSWIHSMYLLKHLDFSNLIKKYILFACFELLKIYFTFPDTYLQNVSGTEPKLEQAKHGTKESQNRTWIIFKKKYFQDLSFKSYLKFLRNLSLITYNNKNQKLD
jgi:hypothetical protein